MMQPKDWYEIFGLLLFVCGVAWLLSNPFVLITIGLIWVWYGNSKEHKT